MKKNVLFGLLLMFSASAVFADPYTTIPLPNDTDCQLLGGSSPGQATSAKLTKAVSIFSFYSDDGKSKEYYSTIPSKQTGPVALSQISGSSALESLLGFSPDPNYNTGSSMMALTSFTGYHIVQLVLPSKPYLSYVVLASDLDYQRLCAPLSH
jgi:hypothetical protein